MFATFQKNYLTFFHSYKQKSREMDAKGVRWWREGCKVGSGQSCYYGLTKHRFYIWCSSLRNLKGQFDLMAKLWTKRCPMLSEMEMPNLLGFNVEEEIEKYAKIGMLELIGHLKHITHFGRGQKTQSTLIFSEINLRRKPQRPWIALYPPFPVGQTLLWELQSFDWKN